VPPVEGGIFPLDKVLGLRGSVYSDGLGQQMVWLSGLLPYAQVEQVFQRLTGQLIPDASIWVETQRAGERLGQRLAQQRHPALVERTRWEHWRYDPRARKSISFDGGMVHVRGEGWKELKVGVVANLSPIGKTMQVSELTYTAALGDVAAFSSALWTLALERQLPYAGEVVVTADGAPWIWRLTADLFPCSVQIVDWYHACQHLAQAAQARFPGDERQSHIWYEQMSDCLFLGQVWVIVADLQTHGLEQQARYFRIHQRRMQYQEFRGNGYPIGSGSVESGVKQFKHRLAAAGMHWSRPGLDRLLVIRTAVLSQQFDALWKVA
jgi:hypothetical protein